MLIYGAVQYNFRSQANDPQVQMAEDAAIAMAQGIPAEALLSPGIVDMAVSLAAYLILFSEDGQAIAANVELHGQTPQLPEGVLEAARQNGGNRITWQPEPGVRSAIVIAPVVGGSGFALAGRSLREVEDRVNQLTLMLLLGLSGSLLGTLVVSGLAGLLPTGRREPIE